MGGKTPAVAVGHFGSRGLRLLLFSSADFPSLYCARPVGIVQGEGKEVGQERVEGMREEV